MQHAHRLTFHGAEFVATKALMVPDVLQKAFGRMRGIAFAQERPSLLLGAPFGIKVRLKSGHGYSFHPVADKVKEAVLSDLWQFDACRYQ
jgi:hypothetical protein